HGRGDHRVDHAVAELADVLEQRHPELLDLVERTLVLLPVGLAAQWTSSSTVVAGSLASGTCAGSGPGGRKSDGWGAPGGWAFGRGWWRGVEPGFELWSTAVGCGGSDCGSADPSAAGWAVPPASS